MATNVNVSAGDCVTVMVCVGRGVVVTVGGTGTRNASVGLAGARSVGAAAVLGVMLGLAVRTGLEPKKRAIDSPSAITSATATASVVHMARVDMGVVGSPVIRSALPQVLGHLDCVRRRTLLRRDGEPS